MCSLIIQFGFLQIYQENVVKSIIFTIMAGFFLSGCSFVEMGGKMTRITGQMMTEYSENNTGIIAKGAGIGGKIDTAVGGTIENIARRGKNGTSGSKGEQFISATKEVTAAAVKSVSTKTDKAVVTINVRAQKRLQELGYNVGTVDGVIGPKTKSALGDYQKKKSLQITQTLDIPTLSALDIRP